MKSIKIKYKIPGCFFTIIVMCAGCSAALTESKPDKLSKKIYKEVIKNNKFQYTRNDTVYSYKKMEDYILEEKHSTGCRLITIVAYNKHERFIIGNGQKFSDMLLGVFKKFDSNGKVIEETNYNKDFAFDFDRFIKKAKNELGLDLNDEKYIVLRYVDEGIPAYFIRYEYNINGFKFIKIDGTNGNIIFNKFVPRTE